MTLQENSANEVAACARAQGFEANITWDFGFGPPEGLTGAQAKKYWEVISACMEQVYPEPQDPSSADIERQYRLLLTAAECLESEGYDIPEPSTQEAFVGAYQDLDRLDPWDPYEFVAEDSTTFRRAVEACPYPAA